MKDSVSRGSMDQRTIEALIASINEDEASGGVNGALKLFITT